MCREFVRALLRVSRFFHDLSGSVHHRIRSSAHVVGSIDNNLLSAARFHPANVAVLMERLLRAQRHHGIDLGRSARRQVAG